MAVVNDASGNCGPAPGNSDNKLSSVNRAVAAVSGTATPGYVGEIVTDTTADINYRASGGLTTTSWVVDNKSL